MTNTVLFELLEQGANFGGPPNIPSGSTFTQALITQYLNDGIKAFMAFTGFAPSLVEKIFQGTIVSGLDYALPADCLGLQRIEYDAGNTGNPIPLIGKSFDEFDDATGDNAAIRAAGTPLIYREPFAGKIRFNPQPNAANVAANDQIFIYYTSQGTMLLNGTDVPNIPLECHDALPCYAIARLLPHKFDQADGQIWMKGFDKWVDWAKTRIWLLNQDRDFTVEDAEMTGENTLYAE